MERNIPSMTDSDSYSALLQSNTSILLTLAPGLIFTNCLKKEKRHGWQPSQPPNQPRHPPTFSGTKLLSVTTESYLYMVIAQSVWEAIVMNAVCNLCWHGKAQVEWLFLWTLERALKWCGVRGQYDTVRNQIHRHIVHKHTCINIHALLGTLLEAPCSGAWNIVGFPRRWYKWDMLQVMWYVGLLHQIAAYTVLHSLYTHMLYIAKRDCATSERFTVKKDACIAECMLSSLWWWWTSTQGLGYSTLW